MWAESVEQVRGGGSDNFIIFFKIKLHYNEPFLQFNLLLMSSWRRDILSLLSYMPFLHILRSSAFSVPPPLRSSISFLCPFVLPPPSVHPFLHLLRPLSLSVPPPFSFIHPSVYSFLRRLRLIRFSIPKIDTRKYLSLEGYTKRNRKGKRYERENKGKDEWR